MIRDAIYRMNDDQLHEIGKILYQDNPDHLKHESKDGTNVLLNNLPPHVIDRLLNYIKIK